MGLDKVCKVPVEARPASSLCLGTAAAVGFKGSAQAAVGASEPWAALPPPCLINVASA